MNEQFVSSEIAEKLKKLNFDEPCLAWYEYDEDGEFLTLLSGVRGNKRYRHINGYFGVHIHDLVKTKTLAPLYQQVQKWLREVHNIYVLLDETKTFAVTTGIGFYYKIIKVDTETKEHLKLIYSEYFYKTYAIPNWDKFLTYLR